MQNEKLPKAFKKKWVDALMSGKYEQGHSRLKFAGLHCCLGVACEVVGAKNIEEKGYIVNTENSVIEGIEKIPDLIHGNSRNPVVAQLTNLNDNEVPFEVIAGVIDEWL